MKFVEFFKRNWKAFAGLAIGTGAGIGGDLAVRAIAKKIKAKKDQVDPEDIVDYEISEADKANENN